MQFDNPASKKAINSLTYESYIKSPDTKPAHLTCGARHPMRVSIYTQCHGIFKYFIDKINDGSLKTD